MVGPSPDQPFAFAQGTVENRVGELEAMLHEIDDRLRTLYRQAGSS